MVIQTSSLSTIKIDKRCFETHVEKLTVGDFLAGVMLGAVLFLAGATLMHTVFGLPVRFLGLV